MRYRNISGIILAGGKSRRMGAFKPFLEIEGKRMIDVIIDNLRPFFREIIIVTDDKDKFLYEISKLLLSSIRGNENSLKGGGRWGCNLSEYKKIKVVEDLVKDCGPLGGIYTGLKKMSEKRGFFVACDMLFLHNGLIKRILDATNKNMPDAVVPSIKDRIEPLHSVYSKRILKKVERALAEKRLSVKDFLKDCHCKYIKVSEDERKSFLNINTPEDLKRAIEDEGKIQGMD